MDDDELRRLARSQDPAKRAILSGRVTAEIGPAAVLSAVDQDETIGAAALLFDDAPAGAGERSQALYRAIVLDSASFPLRQHTAMLCVRRHADEITTAHAKAILRRCLNLAAQPVDPYGPSTLAMAARTAAAALLARKPELDVEALRELDRPGVALVQAAALQGRRVRVADGLAAALEAMRPEPRRALGFARDCDRQYSALDSTEPTPGRVERLLAAGRRGALRCVVTLRAPLRAVGVVALVATGLGVGLGVDAWIVNLPNDVTVSAGEALTALGLLVAVHVLSAELAADRLAGPIARATSFPLSLQAGYLAGLALLVRSLLVPRRSDLAGYSAATIGIVAALVLLVLAALVTLLSRTDPVRAVQSFGKRRRPGVLAAGRTLGHLQRSSVSQRELLSGFAWATSILSPPRGERRIPIVAQRSGYLLFSERRVRAAAKRPAFRDERVRLTTAAPIGQAISAGDEAFSLIPTEDFDLSRSELRKARRLLRVRAHRDIDEIGEYVGTLLGVAVAQARAGNAAGGDRVRDTLLAILDLHMSAVRAARGKLDGSESVGLIPPLRTAAVQAIRDLAAAPDANTHELVLGFLQRLLSLTDAADAFVATLAAQLGSTRTTLPVSTKLQLLWDCGARAIETGDELGLAQVRGQIARSLEREDRSVELGGRLVQFAALARANRAEGLWRWHVERAGAEERFTLSAMRIGASALNVGDASLALLVALKLRDLGTNADAWVAYFEDQEVAEGEKVIDQLYGGLLGADPQFALQEFARFVGRTAQAVRSP
jgi:hypothetical protein